MRNVAKLLTLVLVALFFALALVACSHEVQEIGSAEELNSPSMTVGAGLGSKGALYVQKNLPRANFKIIELPEGIIELKLGKMQGYVFDEVSLAYNIHAAHVTGVRYFVPKNADTVDICVGVSRSTKIPGLEEKLNDFIERLGGDGSLQEISKRWIENPDAPMPRIPKAEHPVGKLVVGTSGLVPPFTFYRGKELVGLDIELAEMFAQTIQYDIEFKIFDYNGIVAAAERNAIDCIFANLNWTSERAESIDFTKGYMQIPTAILVLSGDGLKEQNGSILSRIGSSFRKTFIREGRWKSILSGLGVTLFITICSSVLGIALGFVVCMMRRSGNRVSRGANIAFVKLVQGTPIVVLLMIVYYVVFGSIDMPGIFAAIIGFAINFAADASEMIRSGIETVDHGQIEAGYAIGFNRVQTFWKIVLPQAVRNFMPALRGGVIALLKNTSIVGYIAIVDLTKAVDIIRARTMEAFFPLIATALIYFLVSWVLAYCLGQIEVFFAPKRHKNL